MKALPAGELARVLETLTQGSMVACNSVGNMTILDAEFRYCGFIDMRDGSVSLDENEKKSPEP